MRRQQPWLAQRRRRDQRQRSAALPGSAVPAPAAALHCQTAAAASAGSQPPAHSSQPQRQTQAAQPAWSSSSRASNPRMFSGSPMLLRTAAVMHSGDLRSSRGGGAAAACVQAGAGRAGWRGRLQAARGRPQLLLLGRAQSWRQADGAARQGFRAATAGAPVAPLHTRMVSHLDLAALAQRALRAGRRSMRASGRGAVQAALPAGAGRWHAELKRRLRPSPSGQLLALAIFSLHFWLRRCTGGGKGQTTSGQCASNGRCAPPTAGGSRDDGGSGARCVQPPPGGAVASGVLDYVAHFGGWAVAAALGPCRGAGCRLGSK